MIAPEANSAQATSDGVTRLPGRDPADFASNTFRPEPLDNSLEAPAV